MIIYCPLLEDSRLCPIRNQFNITVLNPNVLNKSVKRSRPILSACSKMPQLSASSWIRARALAWIAVTCSCDHLPSSTYTSQFEGLTITSKISGFGRFIVNVSPDMTMALSATFDKSNPARTFRP